MTNIEFFQIVKENMKEYFANNGYTNCKIYKGKRNSICFEKKVEFYTVDISFNWQTSSPKKSDFIIGFHSTYLIPSMDNPRWFIWSFKTEEELLLILNEIPKKIEEQDFFKKVDEKSYWYFHRENIL